MKQVICIVGPTGSGKTAVGIEVATRLGAEILSIDSRQLYRDFIIGTAQPTEEEQELVCHHLVNFHDVNVPMTAGAFARIARAKMQELDGEGIPMVLVGGSGLYFRAIFDGLFTGPEIDVGYRERLRERATSEGVAMLHGELMKIDPELAAKIQSQDYIRIERGLEVFHVSGKPLSQWWREQPSESFEFSPIYVGLRRDRKEIMTRIATRCHDMIYGQGWVTEVRELLEAGYGPAIEREKFHGYRELAAFLRDEITLPEAEQQINIVTRQYAKRQMTWFRREPSVNWLDVPEGQEAETSAKLALQLIK